MRNVITLLVSIIFSFSVLYADGIGVIAVDNQIKNSSLKYTCSLSEDLLIKDFLGLDLLVKQEVLKAESIESSNFYNQTEQGEMNCISGLNFVGSIFHVKDIVLKEEFMSRSKFIKTVGEKATIMYLELVDIHTKTVIYYYLGCPDYSKKFQLKIFDVFGTFGYTFLNMSYLSAIKSQYLNKLLLSKKTDVGIAVESNTKRGFTKGQTWQCTDVVVLFIENKTYPALVLANDKCDCSLFFPLKSDNLVDEIELNFDVL